MFERALICTNFSDGLHRLVQFIPDLAAGGIQKLTFLYSLNISDDREIPRVDSSAIAAARDRLQPTNPVPEGVEVNLEVKPGKPIENILKVSQSCEAEVIVVGMPSRSLINEKLFGSTTMGLCQRAAQPLLTLRPQLISTYTSEELQLRCRHLFRYLLIPYDGTEASDYLLKKIHHYAQHRPPNSFEECLLCWVFEETGPRSLPREYPEEAAQEKLNTLKAELETLGLTVHTSIQHGSPVTKILEAAQEFDISAIAIASGSVGKLLSWSVPSFAEDLLRRSWHPVLYFPN
jgi:nucleotide-binding universal stress UspA family protein